MILMWLLVSIFSVQQNDTWLKRLEQATHNEAVAEKMIKDLNHIPKLSSVEKAYLGSVMMVMADHAFWPNQKWSYFKKGSRKMSEAVKENPNNAEIRYLRLTCQLNTPSILGYKNDISADKKYLVQHFDEIKKAGLRKKVEQLLHDEGLIKFKREN